MGKDETDRSSIGRDCDASLLGNTIAGATVWKLETSSERHEIGHHTAFRTVVRRHVGRLQTRGKFQRLPVR